MLPWKRGRFSSIERNRRLGEDHCGNQRRHDDDKLNQKKCQKHGDQKLHLDLMIGRQLSRKPFIPPPGLYLASNCLIGGSPQLHEGEFRRAIGGLTGPSNPLTIWLHRSLSACHPGFFREALEEACRAGHSGPAFGAPQATLVFCKDQNDQRESRFLRSLEITGAPLLERRERLVHSLTVGILAGLSSTCVPELATGGGVSISAM